MNIPLKSIVKNEKGYTLIEVILTLAITAIIAGILLLMLQGSVRISLTSDKEQGFSQDFGYLNLYFQKQILKTDKIYLQDNQVYFQDLESADKGYYNKYRFDTVNKRIYRDKAVLKNNEMEGIGLGETSQIASNVRYFNLWWNDSRKRVEVDLILYNQTEEKEKKLTYYFTNEVIKIE